MSTATTYVEVKTQLVTKLTSALAAASRTGGQVQVSYWWPSSGAEPEMVYLGRRPEGGLSPSTRIESRIPTMKSGRKQREETYTIEVSIESWLTDLTPAGAATAESVAFSILEGMDSLLANDPKIGLTSIQWARLGDVELVGGGPIPNPEGSGFLMLMIASIEVQARLT